MNPFEMTVLLVVVASLLVVVCFCVSLLLVSCWLLLIGGHLVSSCCASLLLFCVACPSFLYVREPLIAFCMDHYGFSAPLHACRIALLIVISCLCRPRRR